MLLNYYYDYDYISIGSITIIIIVYTQCSVHMICTMHSTRINALLLRQQTSEAFDATYHNNDNNEHATEVGMTIISIFIYVRFRM